VGGGEDWSSFNPFSGDEILAGKQASMEQCRDAVVAAQVAAQQWRSQTLEQRIDVATRFAEILKDRHEELATLITRENGKPLWESRTEVNACIGKVANSIDAIKERRWTSVSGDDAQRSVIRYRPLGVMAVLGPFNFPAHLPGAHMVPALLAGNSIVFKPSEQTPAVAEFLVRVWQDAGLPDGVLNLVHGVADVAGAIAYDADVAGVLFTGSYRVGKILHQNLAGQPEKMLALELGGNNALVVDKVNDIDAAVHEIILSAYLTSGQRCTCARRLILADKGVGEKIIRRLTDAIEKIRVGDPFGKAQPLLGSLISAEAAEAVLAGQEKWRAAATDEYQLVQQPMQGHPSVLTAGLLGVEDGRAGDSEIFGPLLLVEQAADLDDAIDRANRTKYGLSAGLLSDEQSAFDYFIDRIDAGIVNWNRQTTGASGRLPFGGIGRSGNHRPSGYHAADYCSHSVSSLEKPELILPEQIGVGLEDVFESRS
jgi:succinylglutamic semialdehyde dehydrogenase